MRLEGEHIENHIKNLKWLEVDLMVAIEIRQLDLTPTVVVEGLKEAYHHVQKALEILDGSDL